MLEEAHAVLVGTGEAAFFVAEKLAFHQVFGNRAAVDGDKGAVGARREFVDAAGGLFLTRTGFAGDVDGHDAVGEAADEVAHFDHLRRHAQQAGHIGIAADFVFVVCGRLRV